jgi:DNA-binding CsgD family transcriptional regulator
MSRTPIVHSFALFQLTTEGLSNAEIGQRLFISSTTVETHVTRLLQKLCMRDRARAIVLAYRTGLFDDASTAGVVHPNWLRCRPQRFPYGVLP